MTYNQVAEFGGVFFKVGNVNESEQQSTLKVKLGNKFIEKEIPLKDTNDIVLNITGIIDGLSQTSGQTKAQAVAADRASLRALEDGDNHVYNDGEHSGNFGIRHKSLVIDDLAENIQGGPLKFTMTLVEWK